MPKHYKEIVDEIVNKMDEDAPTNAVAHGGVDMNPTGRRVKKKTDVGTTADAETKIRELIMKKFGKIVKENTDNNNVVLRGINETLNKLEDKIDEKSGIKKEEVKIVEKKKKMASNWKPGIDQFNVEAYIIDTSTVAAKTILEVIDPELT